MDAVAVAGGFYLEGLRYTLILNVMGVGLLIRAYQGSLYILNDTTLVPRWFMATCGLILQLPGAFYLAIGMWSAREVARLGGG